MLDLTAVLCYLAVGLVAGGLGGLLGIGGSIIIIPAMTLLFSKDIHLAQGAAMIVNVFVAVPATLQHHRAGAVQWPVVWKTLPFAIVLIVVGVAVGNAIDAELLTAVFGVFLLYVVAVNTRRLIISYRLPFVPIEDRPPPRLSMTRLGIVGSIVGFMAGVLGIGGGTVTVPLYQRVCRMPLRHCIATSSALMCLTAAVGAVRKNMTLAEHGLDWHESVMIAALVSITAVAGGTIGARLTHVLPLMVVRLAFVILLAITAARMLL